MKSNITYGVSMKPDQMCYLRININIQQKTQLLSLKPL